MNPIPKLLISVGIIFVILGLVWQIGGRYFSIGKLPGDIIIKKENFTFYFPLMTSIILSIVLSGIFYLFRLFK